MQFYSASPLARTRQIVADIIAIVLIIVFVVLGVVVAGVIRALADVGRTVEDAGTKLHGTLSDAAGSLGKVPLVGHDASAPLRRASEAGTTLVTAGQQQQQLVGHVSLIVGLTVALVPSILILVIWLTRRVRFVRGATRARTLSVSEAGVELLALRALTNGPEDALLRVSPNPAAAWRNGEPRVVRSLADLELRRAGVLR